MEELELLKKDWQKKEAKNFPKLTKDDIYKMLLKKSSSSVKWIFIISIVEFVVALFGIGFYLTIKPEKNPYKDLGITLEANIFEGISLIILIYFMYRFYKSYRTISVTDNAKKLMETIIKTRKVVKKYISIMLVLIGVFFFYVTLLTTFSAPKIRDLVTEMGNNGDSTFWIYVLIVVIALVLTAAVLGLCAFLYFIFYGLLLRRLKKNYKEIKQLEF